MLLAVQGAAHRPQSFLGSFFAGHCHYLPGRSRCVLVDSGESCGVEEGGCEAPARPPPVSSLALLAGRADRTGEGSVKNALRIFTETQILVSRPLDRRISSP